MNTLRFERDKTFQDIQKHRLPDGTYEGEAKSTVHRGQRGFFREGTSYTLSVLSNGGYEDEEYLDGAIYHFPQSHQQSHDKSDIEAAAQCFKNRIPIFYVKRVSAGPARYEIQYPAWITVIDYASERLLIEFASSASTSSESDIEQSLTLHEQKAQYKTEVLQRVGQARFRMACIERYGLVGALCDSTEEAILVACHLYPYSENGSNDARNGLILSANHHLLFDKGIIQFSDSGYVVLRDDINRNRFQSFGVIHRSLLHLPNLPAKEALHASRTKIHKQSKYKDLPIDWL